MRLINGQVKDWNTVNQVGWYSGYNASNSHSDFSNVSSWVIALCLAQGGNMNYAKLYANFESKLYIRSGNANTGNWSSWTKILNA